MRVKENKILATASAERASGEMKEMLQPGKWLAITCEAGRVGCFVTGEVAVTEYVFLLMSATYSFTHQFNFYAYEHIGQCHLSIHKKCILKINQSYYQIRYHSRWTKWGKTNSHRKITPRFSFPFLYLFSFFNFSYLPHLNATSIYLFFGTSR